MQKLRLAPLAVSALLSATHSIRQAYWHGTARIAVTISASMLAVAPAWAQEDIGKILGESGTIRSAVRTGLDFGLWLVTVLGLCLGVAGLWAGYQQIKMQEQQRQWGKPLMMLGFGGLMAGSKKIWEWVAVSFTGEPVEDVLAPPLQHDPPGISAWLDGVAGILGAVL